MTQREKLKESGMGRWGFGARTLHVGSSNGRRLRVDFYAQQKWCLYLRMVLRIEDIYSSRDTYRSRVA